MQIIMRKIATYTNFVKAPYMSHLVRKPKMWFPNRSDTDQHVEVQKMDSLEFRKYRNSENKGADQLRSYREAYLRMQKCWFSH